METPEYKLPSFPDARARMRPHQMTGVGGQTVYVSNELLGASYYSLLAAIRIHICWCKQLICIVLYGVIIGGPLDAPDHCMC